MSCGIGYLDFFLFLVGGENMYIILIGYCGLLLVKLFIDLDKLSKGDFFYFYFLDKVFVYKVD